MPKAVSTKVQWQFQGDPMQTIEIKGIVKICKYKHFRWPEIWVFNVREVEDFMKEIKLIFIELLELFPVMLTVHVSGQLNCYSHTSKIPSLPKYSQKV